VSTLPEMATPMGPAVFWKAWMTAEPIPLRSAESGESAAAVAAVSARPEPAHAIAIQAAMNAMLDAVPVAVPMTAPTPRRTKPRATVSLAPTALASALAGSAPAISPPTRGSSRRPEPSASVPRMAWKYCGMVKSKPIMPRPASPPRIAPQVNDAEPNSIGLTSGSPPRRPSRRSQTAKAPSSASPRTISGMAAGSLQPFSPASIRP
jgi:hypothetical protein